MFKGAKNDLIVITGSSGAGRTTALNALEDSGYEIIDNIPISMVPSLISRPSDSKYIALGIDIRTRDFSPELLLSMVRRFKKEDRIKVYLFFLQCEHHKLLSRFNETRRKHPLSGVKSLSQALKEEILLLQPLKSEAQVVIDTTDYSPNELREELLKYVKTNKSDSFTILIQSFSYKDGLPRNLDMVFDCRFLKNPHWQSQLRELDGTSDLVKEFVMTLPEFKQFLQYISTLLNFLFPLFEKEGKTHFSVGIGCTGGKHRSVVVATELGKVLKNKGRVVFVKHRDLKIEKR